MSQLYGPGGEPLLEADQPEALAPNPFRTVEPIDCEWGIALIYVVDEDAGPRFVVANIEGPDVLAGQELDPDTREITTHLLMTASPGAEGMFPNARPENLIPLLVDIIGARHAIAAEVAFLRAFPTSPEVGSPEATVRIAGTTWTWDGEKWEPTAGEDG